MAPPEPPLHWISYGWDENGEVPYIQYQHCLLIDVCLWMRTFEMLPPQKKIRACCLQLYNQRFTFSRKEFQACFESLMWNTRAF